MSSGVRGQIQIVARNCKKSRKMHTHKRTTHSKRVSMANPSPLPLDPRLSFEYGMIYSTLIFTVSGATADKFVEQSVVVY